LCRFTRMSSAVVDLKGPPRAMPADATDPDRLYRRRQS
jgi:hypothetical protein